MIEDNPFEDLNPERYELWVRKGSEVALLAAAASPQGLGLALVTCANDGEFEHWEQVGVLDRPVPGESGSWLVRPFVPML